MILSDQQITEVINENPNASIIAEACSYSRKLRQHIYGEKGSEQLNQIEGYESENVHALRSKYSKGNKDLFTRLSRPIDKVFTARGGSIHYNLPSTLERQAINLAGNVLNGYSVRKWIETIWKPHMLDDPNGIVFMEVMQQQESALAKK